MHRIEVSLKSHLPDARGLGLVRDIHDLGIKTISEVQVMDIYWLDADLALDKLDLICHKLLADPVTQEYQCFTPLIDSGGSVKGRSHALSPRGVKRDEVPLTNSSPSPYQGEGDKGGKVDKHPCVEG